MKTVPFKTCFFFFLMSITITNSVAQSVSSATSELSMKDTIKPVLSKKAHANYKESNPRTNDILHTKLEVSFDWKNATMNGRATISIKPYFYSTNVLVLNARGMTINSLSIYQALCDRNGTPFPATLNKELSKNPKLPSSYLYENDSIKINLGKTILPNQTYTVLIDYVSKPNELKVQGGSQAIVEDKGLYFINPKGENPYKMPQIWTQGETQSNSVWFPTIDSPNEKMTQEIYINVDAKYTTLSNGYLESSKLSAGGTRIDHWKLNQPHAPYLAMMAIGEFVKVTDEPWKGKEISYYVEKEYKPYAKALFGDTKAMIDFFSTKLGVDYPWVKYAQVVVRDYVSGAMENTSATLHGDFVIYQNTREMLDGKKGEGVIAHELFHQWFGDLVTCESWSNLPLNESFATYGEYLWNEFKHGRGEADAHNYLSKQGYMASKKEKILIRFDYDQQEDMFDAFSYNKGGQVLHMLRKAVGDDAFFKSLKNYLETKRYKSAEIHDLRLAFEETTGRDMNWFFNQWFLSPGRPNLSVSKKYNASTQMIELQIEQKQDLEKYPLYRLPLEIDVYANGKKERKHIEVVDQEQVFYFPSSSAPDLVNVDAERQLICDMEYPKTKQEYIYQYKNAPLFEDRLEAMKGLEKELAEKEVFELFSTAALNDSIVDLRKYAFGQLDKSPETYALEVKKILLKVFKTDKNTVNKAKALSLLNKKYATDAEIIELNNFALKEESYAVCSEALTALSKQKPEMALQYAKPFEKENSKKLLFVVANIYAENGSDGEINYFHQNLKNVSGFEMLTFCGAYTKTAKRCTKKESVLLMANDFEVLAATSGKYVKYACVKGIKEMYALWDGNVNNLNKTLEVSKTTEEEFTRLNQQIKEATDLRDQLQTIQNRLK